MWNKLFLPTIAVCVTVSCTSNGDAPPSDADIDARIARLVEMADPRSPEARATEDAEIRGRFGDGTIVDALAVGGVGMETIGFTEAHFAGLAAHEHEYGMTVFNTTVSNGNHTPDEAMTIIEATKAWIEAHSDTYTLIESVADIDAAKAAGKTGIILNFQSSDAMGGDIANARRFYDAGIRQVNFTYNLPNEWAQGTTANSTEDEGLSAMGEELVSAMNEAGIVVDCSHSSDNTCIEAAALTAKPMVMSHTNARALMDIDRNSRDEAILAVGATGGAVCVNYLGGFLNAEGDASATAIAEHVQYVAELIGRDKTCAGVDFVQNYAEALRPVISNPDKYPPEQGYGSPTQMAPPADIWSVARVLEDEYGWTDEELRGYLGENIIRVYGANWK